MLHIKRRIQALKSFTLHAKDGDLGRLREVYFDDSSWKIRYLVVETGHWLKGRQVLITPEALGPIHEEKWTLQIELTREQIETSPPMNTKQPLSRQQEAEYHRHYSWLPYWRRGFWGSLGQGHDNKNQREETEDPHLRSSAEVTGYHIEARDGEVGYVEDFVIDEKDWVIRYLEISTHHGWFGKKILVAPTWIEQVNWQNRKVRVDLLREVIRSAPEYQEGQVIGRDYEISLYSHYGRNQYWE